MPGHAYFNKAQTFFESHYDKGELYRELLKGDCLQKDGELCDTCSSVENQWIGQATKCTPRPYPDPTQLPSYHYLKMKIHLHCTHCKDRSPREMDDYQPRAQLWKPFFAGKINCGDSEEIEEFSKKGKLCMLI